LLELYGHFQTGSDIALKLNFRKFVRLPCAISIRLHWVPNVRHGINYKTANNLRLRVTLAIATPKPEVGRARNLQRV